MHMYMSAVEIATLTRSNEKTLIKVLPGSEVDSLIADYYREEKEEKAREDKAKQEKAAASTASST